MSPSFLRIIFLLSFAVLVSNCERAAKDSTVVSLQLPTYTKVGSLACTKCLKVVAVNVSGEFPLIKMIRMSDKFSDAAEEVSNEVVLEVPQGPARKITVFALYRTTSGTLEAQSGTITADVFGVDPPPITIALTNLGEFKGGSIVGRYLSVADGGPTGRITVIIDDPAKGVKVDLFETEMLNGWFDAFMSQNFKMTYRMVSDGVVLDGLQNVSIDTLTPASTDPTRARFYKPTNYYRMNNSTWIQEIESHDILYGFFGAAVLTNAKRVCIDESTSYMLPNMSLTGAASGDVTYGFNNPLAQFYNVGGVGINSGAPCASSDQTQYLSDRINIRPMQFNGAGNDTAKSIASVFSYVLDGTNFRPYVKNVSVNTTYTFKGLPGLFNTPGTTGTHMYNGIKLYNKLNLLNLKYDRVICDPQWLSVNNFSEQTEFNSAPTVAGDIITFSFTTLQQSVISQKLNIICPTKDGALNGLGGINVRELN